MPIFVRVELGRAPTAKEAETGRVTGGALSSGASSTVMGVGAVGIAEKAPSSSGGASGTYALLASSAASDSFTASNLNLPDREVVFT